jgi:cysteine protease ATG4
MATRAADASRDASRDDGSAETTVIFRVAETATRLKHRVSLVATLPAVRRLRNFLNPHSRLPACDKDMVLLGERYERKRSGDEAEKTSKDEDGEDGTAYLVRSSSDVDAADPGLAAFLRDLRSRVWITYRRGFPAIASGADRGSGGSGGSGGSEDASASEASASEASSAGVAISRRIVEKAPYQYTTDAGWGCTLRVGQMLLANALSIHFFGRGYRRRDAGPCVPGGDARARDPHDGLLSWFGDHPDANACPFSIHEVYRWGRGELDDAAEKKPGGVPGVVPGRWLGPCVTAQAMAALTNARRPGGMCAYVLADEDGTFGGGAPNLDARKVAAFASEKARQLRGLRSNGACPSPKRTGLRLPGAPFDARAEDAVRNDAKEERAKKTEDWAPTLVLVPLVLGIDRHVNARYVPSVAATLRVKQSLGVLGGTPGSSLYVVGAQDDRLFYLDPHTVFPFAESRNAERFEIADVSTYACDDALHMDARELDPSMVLGFYCRARGDLDELCLELELLQRRAGAAPLLTVASARANAHGGGNDDPMSIQQGETAPEPGSAPEPVLSAPTRETEARGADSPSDDEWEFL